MKRSELIEQLAAYLTLNQQVSDESAPGMKLLRLSYTELCKPVDDDSQTADLKEQLNAADKAIQGMNDRVTDYEDILYDLLLQAGLVPEVDGELAISYGVAAKEDPECIEKLRTTLIRGEIPEKASDFIQAVRRLLDYWEPDLQVLWEKLYSEAQRINSLDEGIAQRDKGLQNMESLINKCLEAAGEDWQDVDNLPDAISRLRNGNSTTPVPSDWAQEAIDLAHAVRRDLSPGNRVMAKAAERIILTAPQGEA